MHFIELFFIKNLKPDDMEKSIPAKPPNATQAKKTKNWLLVTNII